MNHNRNPLPWPGVILVMSLAIMAALFVWFVWIAEGYPAP